MTEPSSSMLLKKNITSNLSLTGAQLSSSEKRTNKGKLSAIKELDIDKNINFPIISKLLKPISKVPKFLNKSQ